MPCRAQDHPGGMLGFATPWWPEIRRECPIAWSGKSPDGRALSPAEKGAHLQTCVIDILSDDPIHPVAESIVPMSGFGGGLSGGWDMSQGPNQIDIAARALVSVNLFWLASVQYDIAPRLWERTAGTADRPRFRVYGTVSEFPKLDYFGLGPAAPRKAFVFGEKEMLIGATATLPVAAWLRLGAGAELRRPRLERGGDPSSVEQHFTELTAPGIASQPSFARYDLSIELHRPSAPPYDIDGTMHYHVYQDLGGGRYSFGRFTAAVAWTDPFRRYVRSDSVSRRSLISRIFCTSAKVSTCDYGQFTVRARLAISQTFAGSVVPFYYQPTLGGTDINGFDTLRGFGDYRFRASDDWLGQAEYGHTIWGPLGLLLFYDAGKVALGTSQLNFARVRQDFGAGVSVTVASHAVLRTYVAFGSGEGVASAVKLTQF
jgi:hypothetical protein